MALTTLLGWVHLAGRESARPRIEVVGEHCQLDNNDRGAGIHVCWGALVDSPLETSEDAKKLELVDDEKIAAWNAFFGAVGFHGIELQSVFPSFELFSRNYY